MIKREKILSKKWLQVESHSPQMSGKREEVWRMWANEDNRGQHERGGGGDRI